MTGVGAGKHLPASVIARMSALRCDGTVEEPADPPVISSEEPS